MKRDFVYILIIALLIIGNLYSHLSRNQKTITTTDTVFVNKLQIDTSKHSFYADKVDSLNYLLRKKPKLITATDTLFAVDTVYLSYSSPFVLNSPDSSIRINGKVSTSVVEQSFTFSHIKYRLKEKVVLKTIYELKMETNWYYVGGAFIIGILAGSL